MREFLVERIPKVSPERIDEMFAEGRWCDEQGHPYPAHQPYEPHRFVWFHRDLPDEVKVPFEVGVVAEDERIMVVDKPHFLASIPRGQHIQQSVVVRLRRQFDLPELGPAHRLDRATAGLLLLVKHREHRGAYQQVFARREVGKRYLAVAEHRPELTFPAEVTSHIVKDVGTVQAYELPDREPNAHTTVELVTHHDGLAGYRVTPHTGRTHQIRLHLLRLGIPIVNDPLYPEVTTTDLGDFSRPLQLLSSELWFTDPVTGEPRHYRSRRELSCWPRSS
ncbi:pseudouridine synthase [Aestuariimicrobium soli]|uniref:pseudouridine synthase n=1 Tax=Aestuariimicrobium soli TaxID=2035834 RepID=UPI003EB7AA82